jgi:hypothetical protein
LFSDSICCYGVRNKVQPLSHREIIVAPSRLLFCRSSSVSSAHIPHFPNAIHWVSISSRQTFSGATKKRSSF